MNRNIYRYRRIDDYLFNSLEENSIYFSSFSYLNDPMEGIFQPIFKGDFCYWKSILERYLISLYNVNFSLELNQFCSIKIESIPIYQYLDNMDDFKHMFVSNPAVWNDFFEEKCINELIKYLSKTNNKELPPISLEFLKIIIFQIHIIAIIHVKRIIRNSIKTYRKTNSTYNDSYEQNKVLELNNLKWDTFYEKFINKTAFLENSILSRDCYDSFIEKNKCLFYSNEPSAKKNAFFLYMEFPFSFCESLKKLMFPNFFSASFSLSNKISTMWSHYADNHRGICLEFDSEIYSDFNDVSLNKDLHSIHLDKVNYYKKGESIPQIDFISSCYNLTEDSKRYWQVKKDQFLDKDNLFKCIATSKSYVWKYEKEVRAWTYLGFDHFDYNVSGFKLFYKFEHLKAVYFGLNTSLTEIYKIKKILDNKSKANGQKIISFYKMYPDSNDIDTLKSYKLLTFS